MTNRSTSTADAVKHVAYLTSGTVLELVVETAKLLLPRTVEILQTIKHSTQGLATYLVSGSGSLSDLLPVLSPTSPVVLHVAVAGDLSEVMRLHSGASFFLYSRGGQQAYDNALLASVIARMAQKAVVHVYHLGPSPDSVHELADDDVKRLSSEIIIRAGMPNENENDVYERAISFVETYTGRKSLPFTLTGKREAPVAAIIIGYPNTVSTEPADNLIIRISLLSPFPERSLLATLASVERVHVLDQIKKWPLKWTPLFLNIAKTLQSRDDTHRPALFYSNHQSETLLTQSDASSSPSVSATSLPEPQEAERAVHIPSHESSYIGILDHLFGDRLHILNDSALAKQDGQVTTSPEFAVGRARRELEERELLIDIVRVLLEDPQTPSDLHARLSRWLCAKDDPSKSKVYGDEIVETLSASETTQEQSAHILALRSHFSTRSRWIIGSDAWSYDIGASGLHHAIASGLNINVLVLDTIPYSARNADPTRRKQDVGLYAMNHGDVYVASVAVYASYGQVLQALKEADAYPGPSIVLAYLPYTSEDEPASSLLRETKDAVYSGYWPLYRWDPSREARGEEVFQLDSTSIKQELQAFLDRQNHLSQLILNEPKLAANVASSVGESIRDARKERAQAAYADLLAGIDATPIVILYASDGGNAERKARRLAHRSKARGLNVTLSIMDAFSFDTVPREENVVFITSTTGQGEPPQNGRAFFKAANATAAKEGRPFVNLKYTVFGMGDSHYWPRPEDAGYYNRPGKELDARLAQLGGERFAPLGLGDEQDADGAETGYKIWEPLIWKHFGVDAVEVDEAEPEPITAEHIKAASNYLRGTIAEGLADSTTGALAESDTTLTKFHGVYQQDDRDVREERQAAGVEPAYIFMIRVRVPGGVVTPEQWLTVDQIADEYGAGNYKLTTRQNFQIHGVLKRDLKATIQKLNVALMDTLAAGGDGNRNVLVSTIPSVSKLHEQVYAFGKKISEYLLPRTGAYHEIWLDKTLVAGGPLHDHEPLFRDTFYLPRKIKFAIAVPPVNDIDVLSNCVGFIAIVDEHGDLAGFNVAVGGGMGFTHGTKTTYPRVADVIGFITPDKGMAVVETIFLFHRDNSNRLDRKNARLKYTIDRVGLDIFKREIERMLGFAFDPARTFTFTQNTDKYGWQTGIDGRHHFTCYIENGRVRDTLSHPFKTGLREIARVHKGSFRLTANQHVTITDVEDEDLPEIKRLLAKYKLDNVDFSGLRLSSSACVALPTCPIAMAESERYFPHLLSKIEGILEEHGLRDDAIVARMSGCPNSCSRPSLAELGFIGKAPGSYLMLLGGGRRGERLGKIYRESVTEPEILAILQPMIKRYALERLDGEAFGDFVIRAGYIAPKVSGKGWYERIGGEGKHRQPAD